jgi:hypothetical protein
VAARKERERRAAIEALAGEAIEDGGSEYNPFLEDGTPRGVDDETAGLALAATIAGGDGDDADFANPFVTGGEAPADADEALDPDRNPFLREGDEEDAASTESKVES